jgi:mRNA-degrading endonuclease RelE of RelBE toxin-antitoxin system
MRRSENLFETQNALPSSSTPQPYEVQIPPHVRAVLEKAPRRSRAAIERKLQDAARLAAMRQWVHESEEQHPIRIQLAGYEGTYSIDPRTRQLTLWDVSRR